MKQTVPMYVKIKEDIRLKVKQGIYKKDMRLPSENMLSAELGVSRMTVRRALDELTREGVLYRTRGSGTFVAANKFSQCDIMSFSEIVRMCGATPQNKILEKKFACDEDVAVAMHLPKASVFYIVKRLRAADNDPVGIETVYLPLQFCSAPDKLALEVSLYEELKNKYGWVVSRQDIAVTAELPTKDEKELLNLSKGEAVLKTEGVSLDDDSHPLLYEKNVYSGKSYIMHVSIKSRWVDK